ncbi:hypothetical protein DPMN_171498 [Dreissena polymorpha]|uniref:Uncharacterized protein n=1 Tax=Dreissena polymorpha TaxID=45954 RepID=A0A9D4DY45_DREPO|nr:hypothetical protein DPMN_171498 [Dreissena polymorpha]
MRAGWLAGWLAGWRAGGISFYSILVLSYAVGGGGVGEPDCPEETYLSLIVTTYQTHVPWEWGLNPGCRSEKCMNQPLR